MNYKNLIFSMLSILLLGCVQLAPAMETTDQQKQQINTLISEAYKIGNLGLVKYLIEKNNTQVNAFLFKAYSDEDFELVKCLIENGANVNTEFAKKGTLLFFAIVEERFEFVKYLIEKKANINHKDNFGLSPLHMASGGKGNLKIVRCLIESGAHINAQTNDQYTPLHNACELGNLTVIKCLIEEGNADINAKDDTQWTPLHIACQEGYLEVIKYLIEKGANINAKDNEKRTLLHIAAYSGSMHVVQYLLSNFPALIEEQTVDGVTALDMAYDKKNEAVINLFKQHGIQTVSEKQADANMRAFFAELDQEAQQKQMARAKKKRRNIPNQPDFAKASTGKQKNNQIKPKPKPDFAPVVAKSYDGHGKATTGRLITNDIVQPVVDSSTITAPVISTEIIPIHMNNNTSNEPTTSASSTSCITNSASSKTPIIITTKQPNIVQNSSSNKSQPTQINNEYQVGYDKKLKWPRSLNGAHYNSMRDHLRQLKHWPEITGLDIKPLKGQSGMYRLRVGSYRVVFMIDETLHRIVIHEIGLRKKVYRNL